MLQRAIDAWVGRVRPKDETLWHKWETPWPVRLIDGSRHFRTGQLWRRVRDGKPEYKLDPETHEQILDAIDKSIW